MYRVLRLIRYSVKTSFTAHRSCIGSLACMPLDSALDYPCLVGLAKVLKWLRIKLVYSQ